MAPKLQTLKITNRVRDLRTGAALTQQELADKVGVTRVTINCLERGVYSPSIELALGLARFFRRPVEDIVVLGNAPHGAVSQTQTMQAHLILYVADQKASSKFYERVLALKPRLDVPGMTEFRLGEGVILGLMPAAGIKRLLGEKLPDPAGAAGIPRAELYLLADDPAAYHLRALKNGAKELSALTPRDWGHEAAYSLDPDGHVLAFARGDV
jgi:DNA-binding XRE family transcriptional regulator/catechol 2,3-dioxygenase-like lactoylglutathione lyase family enzyme